MNNRPKISVVMAVYNAGPYLQETLDSLYRQSFSDFEIIAVNDGSKDNSYDILKSQTDQRLRIFDNGENRGIIFSANRGLKEAQGKYIARMDADDICRPERLELQAKYLDNNPACDLVAGFIEMFDNNHKDLGPWPEDRLGIDNQSIRKILPRQNCLAQSTVMFRRELLEKYNYRKISLNARYFAEDYDLWLRLAADGRRLEKIKRVLVDYRVHSNSASVACDNPKLTPKFFSPDFWFACKDISTKAIFLSGRLKKASWGRFEMLVLGQLFKEIFWRLIGQMKKIIKKTKDN